MTPGMNDFRMAFIDKQLSLELRERLNMRHELVEAAKEALPELKDTPAARRLRAAIERYENRGAVDESRCVEADRGSTAPR